MKRPSFKRRRRKAESPEPETAGSEERAQPEPEGKRRKQASRRRGLGKLGLPSLPGLRRRGKGKGKKAKRSKRKGDASGLWFRGSTRVQAVGYWAREKYQAAVKGLRSVAGWAAALWTGRSRRGKLQIAAVAGVLVVWALLRFTALPGVPCSVSTAKECPPGDDTVALVPADALLYAHVTLEEGSEQSERAGEAFERLTELERLVVGGASSALPAPSGAAVDLREDVLSWAEDDLAVTLVPAEGEAPPAEAFVAGVADRGGAEEFLAEIAPPEQPAEEEQAGTPVEVYADGFATAFVDGLLAFGSETAVRSIADAAAGEAPALQGSEQGAPLDDLPEARFAEVYLSRAGVQALLAGRGGPAAQLETFVDYEATSGLAAALVAAGDDTVEVELVSRLDPELSEKSPSFFAGLPAFEPSLADEAGERAIGYVGVGELGPTLADLLQRAGPRAGGLAGSLRALSRRLKGEAGVNPLQDLLPALGGQAALVAEPTDGRPFASLIVEDVDEKAASGALARLQGPLVRALAAGGAPGGQVPKFTERDVEGVTVRSVALSPAVNLSYAVFDEMLVISTSPDGVARVRADSGDLADSEPYERVTEPLPDEVSALVFINLDELFGQVVDIGLAEDPNFADLTVLFENATSAGLAVSGGEELIRTELSLALD